MSILLFDFDGTLVDSSPGILNALKHTFQATGKPQLTEEAMFNLIGPPLETNFANIYNSKEEIDSAIAIYRAYYAEISIHQAQLYKGTKETLNNLQSRGHHLCVTTSKNEAVAKQMLTNFEIDSYFTGIYGAVGNRHDKADVIRACLADHTANLTDDVFIIGDTKYDIIGGKTVGIQTIGVTWGFGQQESLIANGADVVINQPTDLLSYFP